MDSRSSSSRIASGSALGYCQGAGLCQQARLLKSLTRRNDAGKLWVNTKQARQTVGRYTQGQGHGYKFRQKPLEGWANNAHYKYAVSIHLAQ